MKEKKEWKGNQGEEILICWWLIFRGAESYWGPTNPARYMASYSGMTTESVHAAHLNIQQYRGICSMELSQLFPW